MDDSTPLGLKIAIIDREFKKRLDEKAKEYGLTSVQLRVLAEISHLEETGHDVINQKDVEALEHVSHPTMTKIIRQLENKGYVSCSVSDTDHRYKIIKCNDEFHYLNGELKRYDREVFDSLTENLSPETKEEALRVIDQILEGIPDNN